MLKKLLISLLAVSTLGATAYAATEIKVDPENVAIIVTGKIAENANVDDVSVNILYPGKTLDDILTNPADALVFSAQFGAKSTGDFEIVATINGKSGEYTVYTDYEGNTDKTGKKVMFVTNEDNVNALKALVEVTSNSEFQTVLTTRKDHLNLSTDAAAGLDQADLGDKFIALTKEAELEEADIHTKTVQELFDKACVLQSIAEGKVEDVKNCFATLGIAENSTVAKYHQSTGSNFKTKVNDILKSKDAANLEDFGKALEEATVLAVVKCTDAGTIKDVINDYSSEIGISSPSTSSKVYSKLNGKDYASYAALKTGYDQAVKVAGNSNSGLVSSNTNSKKDNSSTIGFPLNHEKADAIEVEQQDNVIFNDIENVAWAKDAILALYGEGIIAGKGEKTFAPNDPLTREQFVTMIVNAFDLKTGAAVNFDDVSADDWFYKAVNAAYNNNITKGMGDVFGVGLEITRQDMAVMVYNAIQNSGKEIVVEESDEVFTDADEIADYAKEAVEFLKNAKIINGMGDGTFNPKGVNTRAQAAVVINAVLNAIKEA